MDPIDQIRRICDEQPHDALTQIAAVLGIDEHQSGNSGELPQVALPQRSEPYYLAEMLIKEAPCDLYSGAQMLAYGRECAEAQRTADSAALCQSSGNPGQLDGERLDWLEEQAQLSRSGISFDWRKNYSEDGEVMEGGGWRFMRHHFLGERKPSIRDAIDAACDAAKGQ